MPRHLTEVAAAACDRIETRLTGLKAPIDAEIRAYPLPIPGCDAQYNYLLERRSEIAAELRRLALTREGCAAARDPAGAIATFLDSCTVIDDDSKAAIRELMQAATLRKAG